MTEEKSRLVRLTAIATQLQSKRMITAREIAEKHHVSIRTVYRDIKALEASGMPIIVEEGKGYTLMEGYKLAPVAFTQEEANALITSEHIISRNTDNSLSAHYKSALMKIKSILRYAQKEKTELLEGRLQIRSNPESQRTSNVLMQLQSALTNFQVAQIRYVSLEGKESERRVEPFAIFSTQGNWILIAFCQLRNDFRYFRLDYIQYLELTEERFEPHQITLEQYFEKCRKNWEHP